MTPVQGAFTGLLAAGSLVLMSLGCAGVVDPRVSERRHATWLLTWGTWFASGTGAYPERVLS
jgi:hypothetical protein